MSAFTVVCPKCRAALRSARPLAAERMVRCPQCGGHFPAVPPVRYPHEPVAETPPPPDLHVGAPPRPPSPYRLLVPAALLATLFCGAVVAATLLFAGGRAPAPAPAGGEADRREEADARDKQEQQVGAARLLARGWEALAAKRFGEAEKAFAAALKAAPDDADALKGLRETHAAMDREARAPADKAKEEAAADAPAKPADGLDRDGKAARADYQARMDAARAAMDARRYADALAEYRAALRLLPDDNAARRGVEAAQARLDDAGERGKKDATFANLMDKARAALRAKRYDDAVASLEAALQLVPGDSDARQLLKDATKARRSAKAEYDRRMAQAEAARAAGRFEEAARGYADALQSLPDDDAATKGLRAVQGVAADVGAGLAAYQRYMTQGGLGMQNFQYADALRAYAEALRLVPGDLAAAQGVRDARAALDVLAQKQLDFDAAMRAGNAALRARQFNDAVRAFTEAQRLIPDSPRAAAGLRQARFGKAMGDGQAAFSARRFGDAVRAFEEALQEVPGDPTATSALRQARAMQRR